jgi:DNA helicase-2/ATP-dependent DNA helicase PcrA
MLRKIAPPALAYTPSADFTPDDVNSIQASMEIEHQKFGIGKIIAVEGSGDNKIATMFFSGIGEKRIMLKYAKVKIMNRNVMG